MTSLLDTPLRRHTAGLCLLLVVYTVGALLVDPSGHLSNDVGGKTASVAAMADAESLNPDLGYWFEEADPDGVFFPFRNTRLTSDGVWINSTSLTTLLPAATLWDAFGPRGILVIPILGSVLAAVAAAALARRVNPETDGLGAMLVVGLASPMLIYALDFWEHSWGAALMVAALVLTLDVVGDHGSWRRAFAAGALLGIAATMRQEALIYAFVAGVTVGVTFVQRREIAALARVGFSYLAGFAVPLVAYGLVESALIGGAVARSGRGLSTLERTGSLLGERVTSSLTWFLAPIGSSEPLALVMGAILVTSAGAFALWVFRTEAEGDPGFAKKAMIVTWIAWLIGIPLLKPGWIPGMLIAMPAAIFGIAAGVVHRRWTLVALSVGPIPLIFATAFVDGASVQWGSRYMLTSGLVLVVVGVEALRRVSKPALTMVVVVSLLVSASGSIWTIRRSHWIADDGRRVVALADDDVVVWENAYNAREMADFAQGQRWLSAPDPRLRPTLSAALIETGVDSFIWVGTRENPHPDFAGYVAGDVVGTFEYDAAFPSHLVRYTRSGGANTGAGALPFQDE